MVPGSYLLTGRGLCALPPQRGLLDPGDITEAVAIAATAGDPLGLPQDTPGAHGINDDRITVFMRGNLGGVEGCTFPG